MNYKLTLTYKGTNFHGWAVQKDVLTIQGYLQDILKALFGFEIGMNASGRTDAYVHALGQVINIKHDKLTISPKALMHAINAKINDDVKVIKCEVVPDTFHARYSAHNKTYCYKINTNKQFNVLEHDLVYQYNKPIDLKKIKSLIPYFKKQQDFLSFSTSTVADTVREIYDIKIKQDGNYVLIYVTGNGFLRNMVRMIVGTFLAYNEDKISLDDILECFKNPKKGKAIFKAPGCGLYLTKVKY